MKSTTIVWPEQGQPCCSRCNGMISVYGVFLDEEMTYMGTWCPQCDPYDSNTAHWVAWKGEYEAANPGMAERTVRAERVELRVPEDRAAWEMAARFMEGSGVRLTRPSPG